jgi:hypothetical protein
LIQLLTPGIPCAILLIVGMKPHGDTNPPSPLKGLGAKRW